MADYEHLYCNEFGEIVDRAAERCVEIRWFDTSADMTAEQFNAFLSTYAGFVEERKRPGALVDATSFRMPMDRMSAGWRDEHIVPRYNAAGLRRFAFHMPAGMPAIGAPPAKDGPAAYPTAYFGSRAEALTWLASED